MELSKFVGAIRSVTGELREEAPSRVLLQHLAFRVDQLGRRLHGLGCIREDEVAGCLTAAVRELGIAGERSDAERTEAVRRSILQLETAVVHAEQGMRAPPP